jgi:hypothetical protein
VVGHAEVVEVNCRSVSRGARVNGGFNPPKASKRKLKGGGGEERREERRRRGRGRKRRSEKSRWTQPWDDHKRKLPSATRFLRWSHKQTAFGTSIPAGLPQLSYIVCYVYYTAYGIERQTRTEFLHVAIFP